MRGAPCVCPVRCSFTATQRVYPQFVLVHLGFADVYAAQHLAHRFNAVQVCAPLANVVLLHTGREKHWKCFFPLSANQGCPAGVAT